MSLADNRVGLAMASRSDLGKDVYDDSHLIRQLVRDALLQASLGCRDPSVPLRDIIQPGMTVLLKPNWVLHCNRGSHGMDCLVTHPKFIEAVLKEVLPTKPAKIIIGDAPIQRCEFDVLVTDDFRRHLRSVCAPCPVEILDFRREIAWQEKGIARVDTELQDMSRYVLFDLGPKSHLEAISLPPGRFRNTVYDPAELAKTHFLGHHEYVLRREAFEADVILNLPKLKTHRKAGLTGAMKNLVGLNGHKGNLPHHRVGGSALGGDCYEGVHPIKRAAEMVLDQANRRLNKPAYRRWALLHKCLLRLNRVTRNDMEMEGGWHGNDTVWRMVLDLNRILLYGRTDGSLAPTPQRKVFSLCDGIIAGEGCGPLASEPRPLGAVTFSASPPFADLCHAALMRFDWRTIPLLSRAFDSMSYPLAVNKPEDLVVHYQGRPLSFQETSSRCGVSFAPAPGWRGHVELPLGS